jgi:hypothetical protein
VHLRRSRVHFHPRELIGGRLIGGRGPGARSKGRSPSGRRPSLASSAEAANESWESRRPIPAPGPRPPAPKWPLAPRGFLSAAVAGFISIPAFRADRSIRAATCA